MAAPTVAIACQGGGTHGAFAYGVLRRILEFQQSHDDAFRITGLSGTSAGALCAFAAWYGLVRKGDRDGNPDEAIATLDRLWETFSAKKQGEWLFNLMVQQLFFAKERGMPFPEMSPYSPPHGFMMNALDAYSFAHKTIWGDRDAMDFRKEFHDFQALLESVAPELADIDQPQAVPRLLIGAIDILEGTFFAFDSKADSWSDCDIGYAAVRASGTLPTIRKAETVGDLRTASGRLRRFWDGLYSQNPPVRNFVTAVDRDEVPDEIWVIRINPQRRDDPPVTLEDIFDRRNELAGNLSLNQELSFIQTVNKWVCDYGDPGGGRCFADHHKEIKLYVITMSEDRSRPLKVPSKFDRSPTFIDTLRGEGEDRAQQFLDLRRDRPDDLPQWPLDALP